MNTISRRGRSLFVKLYNKINKCNIRQWGMGYACARRHVAIVDYLDIGIGNDYCFFSSTARDRVYILL